jgi:hypothetical protein
MPVLQSLSTAERLTLWGLIASGAMSLLTFLLDLVVLNVFILPALIVSIVLMATAGAVATGRRWMPALGALVSAGVLYGNFAQGVAAARLTSPENVWFWIATAIGLVGALIAVVAGVLATAHQARVADPGTGH